MRKRKRAGVIAVASLCALGGAAAGISQSAASSGSKSTAPKIRHSANGPGGWPGGPGGRDDAVHSVSEVLDKAGTAYVTQTTDSGTITAVDASAGTITIKEGTSSVTYATPTLTIPSGSTVTLDGQSSSLEKLAGGDDVTVSSSSEGTTVFATDSSFKPSGPGGHGGPPPGGSGSWSGSSSSPPTPGA